VGIITKKPVRNALHVIAL